MQSTVYTFKTKENELQKVQAVVCDSWNDLQFVAPKYSNQALRHIAGIYQDFFVNRFPFIFGTMFVFHIPEDFRLPFEVPKGTDPHMLTRQFLMKNYKNEKGQKLIEELKALHCMYVVEGKNPFMKSFMPYKQMGFLSEVEGKFKVNASFFTFDAIDSDSPYDLYGTPIGLCVKDGKILNPPLFHREALLVDQKGNVTVRPVELNELKLNISGTIYQRPEYRDTPKSSLNDVVVIGNKVVAVNKGGNTRIPSSGFVISTSEEVKAGTEVIYSGMEEIVFGIQVGNSILINGKKTTDFTVPYYSFLKPKMIQYPPSNYPKNFAKSRAPRIALGVNKEGKPVFIWVEGKGKMSYTKGVDSCGASLLEMSDICSQLGCVSAINLDGGGSAQMIVEGKRELMISDRNFTDNSESERPIPLGIIVR